MVPAVRVRALGGPLRPEREFVLYWMVGARRREYNFGLERAVEMARQIGRPLLVLEALRADYPWASERLSRFVLEGMADNLRTFRTAPVTYYPFVERRPGEGRGLVEALSRRAAVVVTDDQPVFFLPRMVAALAARVDVRVEAVDGAGLLPLAALPRVPARALDFRRHLQRSLPACLEQLPQADPLRRSALPPGPQLPRDLLARWPSAEPWLEDPASLAASLPVDRSVPPVATRGGARAARQALQRFLSERLEGYAERRRDPAEGSGSGLSPWLHFGHISAHEIFLEVARAEGLSPGRLAPRATGARQGYFGVRAGAEAFLDQLLTWRELGYAFAAAHPDHDRYASLPAWARATLARHALDPRPHLYPLAALEAAETHDPLWNAAQREMLRTGRMHNTLRMLWGKKVLEWSPTPEQAFEWLIHLNNRWALDGRDPNTSSGVAWCFGRFDRPWGPERPIFGTVRYMSSESTGRKLGVRRYLERFGPQGPLP